MVTPSEHAGFPKSLRLRTGVEFKRVFQHRSSVANMELVVYAATNGLEYCRLGLVVSRKVGAAVVRNNWKRLIGSGCLAPRRQPTGLGRRAERSGSVGPSSRPQSGS
jgi:ribonuclease P protein component